MALSERDTRIVLVAQKTRSRGYVCELLAALSSPPFDLNTEQETISYNSEAACEGKFLGVGDIIEMIFLSHYFA